MLRRPHDNRRLVQPNHLDPRETDSVHAIRRVPFLPAYPEDRCSRKAGERRSPPRYRATSSCRRLNGPSLRNRAPGEIIATAMAATADLNTAAGFAIGYFQIHPRPDAGAHRDAQSPPTPIVATAGQDPVDWHVAASPGNAAATIAGGPDQSSPRSRSSRRMGSGIAATAAAAALPRSDGAAS